MRPSTSLKVDRVVSTMRGLERVWIALSGGVDSAVLLALAVDAVGSDRVVAVTGGSDSLPPEELEDARRVAHHLGVEHRTVATAELERPGYVANAGDRCYHCRTELFEALSELGDDGEPPVIAYGAIVDDLGDHRPGMRAAVERGVRAPLLDAGLNKEEVREIAADRGLPVRDKPAAPCLASRIPSGSEVTAEKLSQIDRAERALRSLGFRIFRVRHHGEIARVEVGVDEIERLLDPATRRAVTEGIRQAGFRFAALDLEGYRVGGAESAPPALHRIGPARDGGQ